MQTSNNQPGRRPQNQRNQNQGQDRSNNTPGRYPGRTGNNHQNNNNRWSQSRDGVFRKKVTLHLQDGEVAIPWSKEHWENLILVFEACADAALPGDQKFWEESIEWVRHWLQKAGYGNEKFSDS